MAAGRLSVFIATIDDSDRWCHFPPREKTDIMKKIHIYLLEED